MLAPIVLVVAAAAAQAPHNPSKCLEDNGRGLLPDADCIDCSATPRVGCADNFTLSIERHPTVASCHVTRCYGPPAASMGTITTAEAPPAKPLTTTTAPAPEHPTTTAEPTTTTTVTEAKPAWDPTHCMLGPPATCWADTAFQRCPIDRQGAYGAVMAKRGDTQAMHAVYLQLTTTGIGCTKPQTNLDRCLATCAGTTNHGKSYSCNQQLSCDMACKMKYEEGLTTSECNAKCDRTGSSGCRLTVGAATFSMCSSCHRGSAHAAGASIPTQCRSGCAFPAPSSSGSSVTSSASLSASSPVSSSASSSPSTDAQLAPPCTAEQAGEQQRKVLSALQTTADAIVASTKKIVADLKTIAFDTAEAEAELRRLEAALGAKNC